MRNKKVNGSWEQVPFYAIEDKMPLGHGTKSVMLANSYIKLTSLENYGILYHMGWSEPKENYNSLGAAMRKHPFVLAIHEADQEATYLLEEEA